MRRRRAVTMGICALLLVAGAMIAGAQSTDDGETVEIALPSNVSDVDTFLAFRDDAATTPEGGAAVFVLAMLLYESNPDLGHDALVIALDADELRRDANGYRGYTLGNRAGDFVSRYLEPRPYLARSYVAGTSPATAYELPSDWTVRLSRNRSSAIADDRVKLFVACTGADSSRPITLRRNNRGVWKAYEYSSLFVGIRPPEEVVDDPL